MGWSLFVVPDKLRVAAYARVSTEQDEQQSSYEAQVSFYTGYIQSNPAWEFVKVFADEGITGTNTKKRDGINEMIERAMNGEIDLILTKSISRFARNTVDTLQTVRKLKAVGVEVIFEKENIRTDDPTSNFQLALLGAISQDESNSIGLNRRGFTPEQIHTIQEIYRIIYNNGMNTTQALEYIEANIPACAERDTIVDFVRASTRGIVRA